jgi:Flp pilus assembly protein TadD
MPNYMLAVRYLYFNDLNKFKAYAKKALAANKLPQEEKIMQEALQKLTENPKTDATEYGKQLVQLHPESVSAHQMLATYQQIAGKNEDAIQTYLSLINLTENDAPIYNMLGYTYMRLDHMDKAKEAFDNYIKLEPKNPNVYDSMGDYYMAVKDYKNAYTHFMKAHQINEAWSYEKAMKAKEMMGK